MVNGWGSLKGHRFERDSVQAADRLEPRRVVGASGLVIFGVLSPRGKETETDGARRRSRAERLTDFRTAETVRL